MLIYACHVFVGWCSAVFHSIVIVCTYDLPLPLAPVDTCQLFSRKKFLSHLRFSFEENTTMKITVCRVSNTLYRSHSFQMKMRSLSYYDKR